MGRKLLAISLLAGATTVALVLGLDVCGPKVVYAHSVSAFVARPVLDTPVRVDGTLVHGSLCKLDNPCEYRFRITGPGSVAAGDAGPAASPELAVRYPSCVVPDTFRDVPGKDVGVSVQGEMCKTCHAFEASSIMAKWSGGYQMYRDGGGAAPVPTCR